MWNTAGAFYDRMGKVGKIIFSHTYFISDWVVPLQLFCSDGMDIPDLSMNSNKREPPTVAN